MATSTRYLGTCPVCQRQIKVRDGELVHHGYLRPGTGEIVGDCFGVGYPPYELSPEGAAQYLRQVAVPQIASAERHVRQLGPPSEPEWMNFEQWDRDAHVYVPVRKYRQDATTAEWEGRLRTLRRQAADNLTDWQTEVARLESMIEGWRPAPMTTVEEETVKATEQRSEREQRRASERERKLAEALVSLQGRIDSAVRSKRPDTLRDLFQDGYRKLATLSRYELKRPDVLRLLERDDVWGAFGLIRADGSYLDRYAADAAFRPWSAYQPQGPAPWPESLGGGKAKVRR